MSRLANYLLWHFGLRDGDRFGTSLHWVSFGSRSESPFSGKVSWLMLSLVLLEPTLQDNVSKLVGRRC
jgi:hypothetical protein